MVREAEGGPEWCGRWWFPNGPSPCCPSPTYVYILATSFASRPEAIAAAGGIIASNSGAAKSLHMAATLHHAHRQASFGFYINPFSQRHCLHSSARRRDTNWGQAAEGCHYASNQGDGRWLPLCPYLTREAAEGVQPANGEENELPLDDVKQDVQGKQEVRRSI